jgi:hypothetical protein
MTEALKVIPDYANNPQVKFYHLDIVLALLPKASRVSQSLVALLVHSGAQDSQGVRRNIGVQTNPTVVTPSSPGPHSDVICYSFHSSRLLMVAQGQAAATAREEHLEVQAAQTDEA